MTTVAPPPKTVTDESNPRGIPKALFIVRLSLPLSSSLAPPAAHTTVLLQEDVDAFIGGPDGDAELALKTLQETLAYVSPSLTAR